MEVSAEAKRIMVVALGKLYSSRTQRGGLRLHRSLLLTLVMKSARDMYHAAQAPTESVASGCEQQQQHPRSSEITTGPNGAQLDLQVPSSPRTLTQEEVEGSPTELHRDAQARNDAQNKENACPGGPVQHSRKRRGKAAVEPDFLPCKKAKLEQGTCPQQLIVNSVLMDYVNCSSELGAPPTPMPLQRAIAAC
ncbi:Immediate early response gene 2 protein [Nibea albiflora]|uniref:Immediate early response gene 2 protein n=1 Tax=Nibea albiflora TaxID=240163 RepID=A0ACB7EYI7_NIBAL|nr:Immediate early response gene 2 protein [Nibea albiflora]